MWKEHEREVLVVSIQVDLYEGCELLEAPDVTAIGCANDDDGGKYGTKPYEVHAENEEKRVYEERGITLALSVFAMLLYKKETWSLLLDLLIMCFFCDFNAAMKELFEDHVVKHEKMYAVDAKN